MKLALLGADPAMLAVASAAIEHGGHVLVMGIDALPASDLRRLAPHMVLHDDWEALLAPGAVDGVLVARGPNPELRTEQLRKLIQEGIPLLVSHPLLESMLVHYEFDMIRRESKCHLLPYLPARWHPAVADLRKWTAEMGGLEQLTIERRSHDRGRDAVLAHFARDIDLARLLVGELTHLSAHAVGSEDIRYANLAVQLSGPGNVPVRCSTRPSDKPGDATLTLQTPSARAELTIPDQGDWTLGTSSGDQQSRRTYSHWDPALEAVNRLERMIAGDSTTPDWIDACRAVELTETIDRSLKRGRTIELHYEEYSEQGTFKGMMTSLGCGLLVAALFIVLLAAIAGRLGLPLAQHWATLLLLLLGGFLALQALRLVFPRTQ